MSARFLPFFATLLATTFVHADPADTALTAAMNLSTAPNYSWHTQLNQNGRPTEIRGQTSDGGYSMVTFVGFSSPASPSHPTAGGGTGGGTNAVFQGDSSYVIETAQGWVSPGNAAAATEDEPAASNRNSGRGGSRSAGGGGGMRGMRGGGRRGGLGTTGQRGGSRSSDENDTAPANPKLPGGINLPHEELAILAANNTDLHFEDGVLTGKLTQSGADLLLAPPGSSQRPPEGAAGSFRIWLKDGAVAKYEWTVTAKTGLNGATVRGGLNETATVELSDVGSTHFNVPDAAKRKLGT